MKLREDLTLRKIGNDYMIVDPGQDMVDMSKVYTLNETAAWLWGQLVGKDFNAETIVELLLEYYDVDKETASTDAQNLIEVFTKQGVLQD